MPRQNTDISTANWTQNVHYSLVSDLFNNRQLHNSVIMLGWGQILNNVKQSCSAIRWLYIAWYIRNLSLHTILPKPQTNKQNMCGNTVGILIRSDYDPKKSDT